MEDNWNGATSEAKSEVSTGISIFKQQKGIFGGYAHARFPLWDNPRM